VEQKANVEIVSDAPRSVWVILASYASPEGIIDIVAAESMDL
jgi:hypothetical protein